MIRILRWMVALTVLQITFVAFDALAVSPRPGSGPRPASGYGGHASSGSDSGSSLGASSASGGRGWQAWVVDEMPPLPPSSIFPEGNVNVPPSASCPPRCPDDDDWYDHAFKEVAPVYAVNERYDEMLRVIEALKQERAVEKDFEKALKISSEKWLGEFRLPQFIEREARSRIKAEATKRISEALATMMNEAIRARQKQLGKIVPYWWDIRSSSREKTSILERGVVELNWAQQTGVRDAKEKVRDYESKSKGNVVWHGSAALQQGEKIRRDIQARWPNQ